MNRETSTSKVVSDVIVHNHEPHRSIDAHQAPVRGIGEHQAQGFVTLGQVIVEQFKERENGVTFIGATIYVDRDNHKKMVIGRNGEQLRKIGAAARRQIEELIQARVYLELWVKVEPRWRSSEQALKRFGYSR